MNSDAELNSALRNTLQQTGALSRLQSLLRAEIYKALDTTENDAKPTPSDETMLLNELIMEYLEWHGFGFTKGVFVSESNQPAIAMNHERLAMEFNLSAQDLKGAKGELPILYHVCFAGGADKALKISDKDHGVDQSSLTESMIVETIRFDKKK